MTLAEARQVGERAFIKPAEDKCFEARAYSSRAELPVPGPLPENLAVLVQEVVEWQLEFRCFALDGRVITASPYWRDGWLAQAEDEAGRPAKPKCRLRSGSEKPCFRTVRIGARCGCR